MHTPNPDKDTVKGQGNDLDRGADEGSETSERPKAKEEHIVDDELARPPEDRSPLT